MEILMYQLEDGHLVKHILNDIYFDCKYDVVVAGLGTSGSFAAITAAREGVSVLGVERGNCIGGMSTAGSINGYYFGFNGGLFEEIDQRIKNEFSSCYSKFGQYHPEAKKYLLERYCIEAGVVLCYKSVILAVYMQNDRIIGIKLLTEDGIKNIQSTVLIDATSDGHIIRLCGVKTFFGRNSDRKAAPFSSVMTSIDKEGIIYRSYHDSGYGNQYNANTLSQNIIEAHSSHITSLKKDNLLFLYLAPQIGFREGLRFEGEETLTFEDILTAKEFEKTLFYAYSDIDKHGCDTVMEDRLYQDWWVVSNLSTVTAKIGVPLGAIIPKGIKGIFSAGRCLSLDCYASSAVRMIRDMYRLGECEGIAAAMCVKESKDLLDIDYLKLRSKLCEHNCFDPEPDKQFGFDFWTDEPYKKINWLTDITSIRSALSTDTPGVAIWSCKKMGNFISESLVEIMNTAETEMLKYNSAIALCLLEDSRAIPILHDIVKNRSCFYFKDCRRSNQLRSVIALCLLGRFCDESCLDTLCEIVYDDKEYEKELYHTINEPIYIFSNLPDFNAVYFQHFFYAAFAIFNIVSKAPQKFRNILIKLKETLENKEYVARIVYNNSHTSEYQMICSVGEYLLEKINTIID